MRMRNSWGIHSEGEPCTLMAFASRTPPSSWWRARKDLLYLWQGEGKSKIQKLTEIIHHNKVPSILQGSRLYQSLIPPRRRPYIKLWCHLGSPKRGSKAKKYWWKLQPGDTGPLKDWDLPWHTHIPLRLQCNSELKLKRLQDRLSLSSS